MKYLIALSLSLAPIAFGVFLKLLLDQKKNLSEIHVLVNSRLTEALDEIQALKRALVVAKDDSNG